MGTKVIQELEKDDLQYINGGILIELMTFVVTNYGDDMVQGFKDGWNYGHNN